MDKEYSLIVDTNIFYIQELNDYSTPYLYGRIEDLVNKLEINDILDKIEICIPKVSLLESFKQQDERYDIELNKFNEKKYPLFTPHKKKNYMDWLSKCFNIKLQENNNFNGNVKILDYPRDTCFKSIINRAILKKDPFEGEKGESDKGFKDVLIWYTLLEYKSKNKSRMIILYSNDKKLTSENCINEYKKKFKQDLIIAKREKDPNFDDVIKDLFNLDRIELSLDDKISKDIQKSFLEHFQPQYLYNKPIYTSMGEKCFIDDIINTSCYINRSPNIEDEYDITIRVDVNTKRESDKNISGIFTLNSSIKIEYLSQFHKYHIKSFTKLHKDISVAEMFESIKFLEENNE